MRTRFEPSADQELMGQLLGPPDLGDGIQSLGYWQHRSRRLPWYRLSARREAKCMTIRWEQRVAAAVLAQRTAPVGLRVSGGLLLARIRVGRWARRARVGLVAAGAITAVFIAIPVVAVAAFLIHAL